MNDTNLTREIKAITVRLPLSDYTLISEAAKEIDTSVSEYVGSAALKATQGELGTKERAKGAILIDGDTFVNRGAPKLDVIESLFASRTQVVARFSFSSAPVTTLAQGFEAFLAARFRHELVGSRTGLQLAMATCALDCMTRLKVEEICIVTGDPGMAEVAQTLSGRGLRLFGIGAYLDQAHHEVLARAFAAKYVSYEGLAEPPNREALRKLRLEAIRSLLAISNELVARGTTPIGSRLIPLLKHEQPTLSKQSLEVESWRELAEIAVAEGLAAPLEASGLDFVIRDAAAVPSDAPSTASAGGLQVAGMAMDARAMIDQALRSIMGIPMPSPAVRIHVFAKLEQLLAQAPHGLPLLAASHQVADEQADQNTVYRLLKGLSMSGALVTVDLPTSGDTLLMEPKVPGALFDDAFVMNCMRAKAKFPGDAEPSLLAEVLFGDVSEADRVRAMQKVLTDPLMSRRTNLRAALALARAPE